MKRFTLIACLLLLLVALPFGVEAQVYYTTSQPVTYAQPVTYYQPVTYAQPVACTQPACTTGCDVNGFMSWLNSLRSQYGLSALAYDQNLSSWAAVNNQSQMVYGLGHHVMGTARRQNAAVGYGDIGSVGAAWLASPGHAAALLDPTIHWFGLACAGGCWTFNAK